MSKRAKTDKAQSLRPTQGDMAMRAGMGSNPQMMGMHPQMMSMGSNPQMMGMGTHPQMPMGMNPQMMGMGMNPQMMGMGMNPQMMGMGSNSQMMGMGGMGMHQQMPMGMNPHMMGMGAVTGSTTPEQAGDEGDEDDTSGEDDDGKSEALSRKLGRDASNQKGISRNFSSFGGNHPRPMKRDHHIKLLSYTNPDLFNQSILAENSDLHVTRLTYITWLHKPQDKISMFKCKTWGDLKSQLKSKYQHKVKKLQPSTRRTMMSQMWSRSKI